MIVIVGLGNPGRKYSQTPHNIGFEVIDLVAREHGIRLKVSRKFLAKTGEGEIAGKRVALLKPTTYVNLSGETVFKFLNYNNLCEKDLLVVTDDINLPMGRIRIRAQGSHGGHNGLRSIINRISTQFSRVRIGICPLSGKVEDAADYVLTPLWGKEKKLMAEVVDVSTQAVETFLKEGLTKAMDKYNSLEISM